MKSKYDIIWLNTVDSTNDEARRCISDLDNLSVVSALSQTKGRGQRGNTWDSEPGENLLFSVIMKFDTQPEGIYTSGLSVQAYDQFVISQIASLSVVDLLASHGIEAKIKWPNDIYVGCEKICGILVENAVRGKWLSSSIIGIGLNVNQRNFNVNLPNPTSMALCLNKIENQSARLETKSLLEEFMQIFSEYSDRFCHIKGGYNRLNMLYLSQLWRKDEVSEFMDLKQTPGKHFKGVIRGISTVGHLMIEMESGEMREYAFKEISLIFRTGDNILRQI